MVFLRTLGLLVALRAYGCTQQACLHFAESRSSVSLQSFAHFLWPTPPQPGFALGLHRRCTFFESFFVHVVGSSSAAQLTVATGSESATVAGRSSGTRIMNSFIVSATVDECVYLRTEVAHLGGA